MNIPSEIKPPFLSQCLQINFLPFTFLSAKGKVRHLFFSREYNSLFGYYYICNNDNSFFACVHHHGQIWWRGKKWWNTGCLFCFFLFLFCFCFRFRFFLVKRFQSVFLIFIIFLTAITIAVIKTFFFSFLNIMVFVCLFLCCDAELWNRRWE